MSRNPNTDPPQPGSTPEDVPPTRPDDPLRPDPNHPEPLPMPPGRSPSPPAPVREPDTPPPIGDPGPNEPTRLV